jgi:hypothetical protein
MILRKCTGRAVLCLFSLALLSPLGCKSAAGEGAGPTGDLSSPLTMLPEYQARAPRTCTKVTKPPSAAQAVVMVQCTMDTLTPGGLGLVQDVKLELGSSRPFVYYSDAGLDGIDLNARVYPLRGSYTFHNCSLISNMSPAGKSCIWTTVEQAVGWCWKTSFGDYKCKMQGAPGGSVKSGTGPAPVAF